MSVGDELLMRNVKLHSLTIAFTIATAFLFSSQCHCLKENKFRCKLVNSCMCMFENEEGYNLSSLSVLKNGLNASINNLTFYFQPCSVISVGNSSHLNECPEGTSVCLYNHTSKSYSNLGLSREVQVISDGLVDVAFVYAHNNSITTVQLECDSSNSLTINAINAPNKYELKLNSPSACRQRLYLQDPSLVVESHLSTGSVIVIILIVFASLYFVGGALILKFLRGAEGVEMIPNHNFWINLPGHVKNGFMFVTSGCQTSQAYDRI